VQVAERALFLWNNEYIVQQITSFRHQIFPIVFEALAKNAGGPEAGGHWNPCDPGFVARRHRPGTHTSGAGRCMGLRTTFKSC
jgi:hypothetical protein